MAAATQADINRAVAAARAAFDTGPWPRMSHGERAGYLNRIAEELDRRAADVAAIWPNEMGILHSLAQAYAGSVGNLYRYYAGQAERFPFEEERRSFSGAELGLLVQEPVGVVGAIIPWNGAISLIAFKLAPALLAGCTVVIKASPEAPGHALLMAEVVQAAGIPPGVVNVLTAQRSASEALVSNPDVDKIAFTGSSAAGKRIAEVLSHRVGRYTLELGGKSAAIVLDDYDLEEAARMIAAATPAMTCQVCAALTRIIITRSRHDALVEALAAEFAGLRIGNPFDPTVQMGPLATQRQLERVRGYIDGARADGFTLATGGDRPQGLDRGWFITPTVFGDVDNSSTLAQEEVFGPVLAVIPAEDEADAVRLANQSIYGLNGAVFTNDADRAYAVARAIRTGTVGQNGFGPDFSIAFGGFKQSGIGREGGIEGLRPYLESKTVLLAERPSHLSQARQA